MSTSAYIQEMANKYGLNVSIFSAMLNKESGQRHYGSTGAVLMGGAGEIGIGQIKPGTAADLGIDPYDERQNIEGAAKYLSQQLKATGNYREALAAYNQGLAGSRGRRKAEGLAYADSVLSNSGQPSLPEFVENGIAVNQRPGWTVSRGTTGSGLFGIGDWLANRGSEVDQQIYDEHGERPWLEYVVNNGPSLARNGAFVIAGVAILIVGLVFTNNSAKNFVLSKVKGK